MADKTLNYKLFKICYHGYAAEMYDGIYCLRGTEVLNDVLVRDFLQKRLIPFMDKGKRYLRHYIWEPQGGVAKIKIGCKKKGKFEGAIVYINYSKLSYEPYVAILDKKHVFDSFETVANMVARALSYAYKGTGVTLGLEPWIRAEGEKIMWGRDCMMAHDMGDGIGVLSSKGHFGLETFVNKKPNTVVKIPSSASPPKKNNLKPAKYSTKILKGNKRRVMRYLHAKIDELNAPKDFMKVVLAAIAAGVIGEKVEYTVFQDEFHKDISKTQYNHYIRNRKNKFLGDDLFNSYYQELLNMV